METFIHRVASLKIKQKQQEGTTNAVYLIIEANGMEYEVNLISLPNTRISILDENDMPVKLVQI